MKEPETEERLSYDEEIRLIAGIVERADRGVRPNAWLLIIIGVGAALINLCYYVYYWRYYYLGSRYAAVGLLVFAHAAGIAVLLGSAAALLLRRRPSRWTAVDVQLATTFGVAIGLGLLTSWIGYPTWVMAGPDYSVFWVALLAIPMLSIGLQYADRKLLIGGGILVASLVAARLDLWNIGLYLAFGVLLGIAGPGVAFAVRRRG